MLGIGVRVCFFGSIPRMRGTRGQAQELALGGRIIPAACGRTLELRGETRVLRRIIAQAHAGNSREHFATIVDVFSPIIAPRMRGTLNVARTFRP